MKKLLALTLAMLIAIGLFTGCVPGSTTEDSNPDPSSTPADSGDEGGETDAVFNETGLPIVNETMTFTVSGVTRKNKDFEELLFFQNLEESTGVDIEWIMSSTEGWSEKKSLMFAGNDLPDAFYGAGNLTDVEIVRYGSQGMLIPLNDYIEPYAPNLNNVFVDTPSYLSQITAPDGNVYTLPKINELTPATYEKMFLNKTWLDQLDLPIPTTVEEFETTLQAFKDNDMNGNGDTTDEIPFTFRNFENQDLSPLFGAFGQIDSFSHFIVQEGEVIYTAATEPWKEAVDYFSGLYMNGLIDNEGFTHDASVYGAKIKDENKIVGGFLGWTASATAGANAADFVAIAPLEDENGNQVWMPKDAKLTSKGSFAITNVCENPEVLIRWIDESYEPEMSLQVDQGMFGYTLEKTDDGKYEYLELPEGVLLDTQIHDYSPGNDGVSALITEVSDNIILNANLQERVDLDIFYDEYNIPLSDVYPNVLFTPEEVERIAVLKTDIDAHVSQSYANWISNGGIEADWDEYLTQLDNMNLTEYIEIYQSAYDRFVAAN